ncbi:YjjG family noncanonical pyrimidine nucleotidase [Streptococcus halotolerans]|uniref:YjjG family noncanonical pyrimidine nucleotidase n=1 Tax=Streptococcus halotolerans TaxID=1814128 RepID=UPI000787C5C1|nr:YjjG family noncanonical pyrimidine nucleotidase [Streptococcus halotolerans]
MYYKYLLFDLDHTLLDFEAAEDAALTEMLLEVGVEDVDAYKTYYKPMNQQLWRDLEAKKITKSDLVKMRFVLLFEHFGHQVDGEAMAMLYEKHISQQGQTYLGAHELLEDLIAAGYEIYGATNGITAIQEGRLLRSSIGTLFNHVFISEQAGTAKPDLAYYDWIGANIEAYTKAETLMIGDSLTADIQGGHNAGLDTMWYNPNHQVNNSGLEPNYVVSDYDDIRKVLLP